MDTTAFVKAVIKLQSFRQNLPEGDVEETYVADYHGILDVIHQQSGYSFQDFFIPGVRLARYVTSYHPPSRSNRFQEETRYSDSRCCDREFFLMQIDAAIMFLNSLQPKQVKNQIGF